jgi:hypothetical protein
MTRKPTAKPKLTDAERHKRFLEEARRAEASDDPEDFDRALVKVATPKAQPPKNG